MWIKNLYQFEVKFDETKGIPSTNTHRWTISLFSFSSCDHALYYICVSKSRFKPESLYGCKSISSDFEYGCESWWELWILYIYVYNRTYKQALFVCYNFNTIRNVCRAMRNARNDFGLPEICLTLFRFNWIRIWESKIFHIVNIHGVRNSGRWEERELTMNTRTAIDI